MEIGVERLLALCFVVIGLSHITASAAWTDFFVLMRRQERAAGLINAYVHFPIGALVVAFHWNWSGPAILATVLGCFLALKGALLFVWPAMAHRTLSIVSHDRASGFRAIGAVMIVFGALVGIVSTLPR